MGPAHFFPFDPRATRRTLVVGACALAVLAAWAAASAREGARLLWVGATLYALLAALFALSVWRLRPRAAWGVTLAREGLTLARPLTRGPPLELDWDDVAHVRRAGRRGEVLQLGLEQGAGVVRLTRLLFPSREAYEALALALEQRLPAPRTDA